MGYTVKYDHITDPALKKQKALDDVRFWLGKQYDAMSEVVKEEIAKGTDRDTLLINIEMFLGFSGYPVHAWLDELGCPPQTPNNPSGTAES
jgi:hypothetical protein